MWSSLRLQLDAHRPSPSGTGGSDGEAPAVPVAILTGFLGAGKSTVLARLLTAPPDDLVIRAVVNDVGSLPFDPTMIAEASTVDIELTNGCGCCERATDMADTLRALAVPAPTGAEGPGLIVLEAAGTADPLALAQIVEADPGLALDRIVAVVDAAAVWRQLDDPGIGPVLRRQLDAAHSVVLSHTEDLSPGERAATISTVAELVPGRVIVTSTRRQPASEILWPRASRGARIVAPLAGVEAEFTTLTLPQVGPAISRTRLRQVLTDHAALLVRAKGRLELDDGVVHVQVTSSGLSIEAATPGPCGLTVVTRSVSDIAAELGLLGLGPAAVGDPGG